MKHLFSAALAVALLCGSYSSAQDILWEKSFGGKHADYLFDAVPTADYGFILAGSSLSDKNGKKRNSGKGNLDYWLWKMDEHGTENWQKNIGGSGADLLQSIRLTKDGGFILAGTSNSPKSFDKKEESRGGNDYWVIKLDANGGELWQKTIGGSGSDDLTQVAETKDGGYILAGTSSSEASGDKTEKSRGSSDYWFVKLDHTGKIEWQHTYGGQYSDILRSMEVTTDGGFIVGGWSNSPESGDKTSKNFGTGDYWILKLDKTGAIEWQQAYGGDKDDQLYVVHQTHDGGYIAGGNSNSGPTHTKKTAAKKGTDFWVVKMNDLGESQWQESYDFGKNDILTSLTENNDHTFLIGGYAQSEVVDGKKKDKAEINDYIVLKIKENGEEKWSQAIGSDGEDILRKSIEVRDGGYILAGTSNGAASRDKNSAIGRNDFWVVKLRDKDKPKKKPQQIEAIPNPALAYTNVIVGYEFQKGTATVYDLGGRQLQQFPIDNRTVPVNLSGLPEGIYIVQIATEKSTDSVKIVKGITN